MLRSRTSLALGLGLGTLLASMQFASAQSSGTEPPATPVNGSAAPSSKTKPAAAKDGAPRLTKKPKKSRTKAASERTAAAEPPVPAGTAAADTGHPKAAHTGKPAADSRKPPPGSAAAMTAATTPAKPNTATAPATTGSPSTAPAVAAPGTGGTPKPGAEAAAAAAKSGPKCKLEDPEQPRGGRLDVIGSGFGSAPLVRLAGKPLRMIERRDDRISVQVPADSDGGQVAVQAQGVLQPCGTLVIIGKNR